MIRSVCRSSHSVPITLSPDRLLQTTIRFIRPNASQSADNAKQPHEASGAAAAQRRDVRGNTAKLKSAARLVAGVKNARVTQRATNNASPVLSPTIDEYVEGLRENKKLDAQ